MRQKVEDVRRKLEGGGPCLAMAKGAIQAVEEAAAELADLEHTIRQAETLANPENYRVQMEFDAAFAAEFLRRVDPPILRLALLEAGEEVRAYIRQVLEIGHE